MAYSYIKKISLEGFKSFRHKTDILFEPGFNAIVGPNGSGKSNLLDACVFVFGFPSRLLRASKMENLLFKGGEKKKKTRFCCVEVEIMKTLEDGGHEEILISRKINPQGVSYYRLNNKGVSKAEIDKVLGDANIKPKGENIIQQGDITNVLKVRPRERREIIDEVAGIHDFNEKKIKAFAELEIADRNLEGVAIAHAQKKEYYEKIKEEKELALNYRKIEDEVRQLRLTLVYSNLKGAEEELESIDQNLEIKKQEIQILTKEIEEYDAKIIEREEALERREERVITDLDTENTDLKNTEAQINELSVKITRRETEIESKQSRIDDLEELKARAEKNSADSSKMTGSYAVRTVLESRIKGIINVISQLYSCDEKYATAIYVALGGHMNDVVVQNEDTAIKCIDFLKKNSLGRVRFLPLSRINMFSVGGKAQMSSQMPGVIDFAKNLCSFDDKHDIVFSHILRDILVVEDATNAKMLKGIRCVTLEGDLFEAGGAIVGGKIKINAAAVKSTQVKKESEDYDKKINLLEKEIQEHEKELNDLRTLLSEKEKEAMSLDKQNNMKEFYEEKKRHGHDIDELKFKKKEAYENRVEMEKEVSNLSMRKIRMGTDIENFKIDYNTYDESQMENIEKESPLKLKRKIRELELQLEKIGMVNLRAIDECEIYEKEFAELNTRLDKLKEEKQMIVDNINMLEVKRKSLFFESLRNISDEFNKIFTRMMEDGEAHLELEKEDDIDSGLLLKTKLKNVERDIDALSGGEKTMTAFAFLFAILRYKPSLFYILDEIDAALDKENAEKISTLINSTKDTQFLLISHNEYTVRNADRVYGISMQDNESKIFSIKLE
ncbi:MAG: chromosome segregation protein SMC [Candidatus Aenigmarchaeota archaeon]|nr:chromosome segregation protein SMC [Candidatus Aenigmarchaeota archaeon]